MSGLSVITTRLHRASILLKPYLLAMGPIRARGGRLGGPEEAKSLLGVLVPLDRHLRGVPYFSLGINGRKMSEFLRVRHREEWPRVRDGILSITERLEECDCTGAALSDEDMRILRYVADALDYECASLFNEARRR